MDKDAWIYSRTGMEVPRGPFQFRPKLDNKLSGYNTHTWFSCQFVCPQLFVIISITAHVKASWNLTQTVQSMSNNIWVILNQKYNYCVEIYSFSVSMEKSTLKYCARCEWCLSESHPVCHVFYWRNSRFSILRIMTEIYRLVWEVRPTPERNITYDRES